MSYILVALGGGAGSIVRYVLGKYISEKSNKPFPLGTFIINVTGAILLGIVSSIGVNTNMLLLLADGFLGAYTTFSTFMYEGFNLFKDKEKLNAFIYISGSLILGVLGFYLGSIIATI
ncbi:fluoride efflux transporter CrcB [Clostridium paridis]|uniref:Fluoride-specific ion channel FluC n=1 Tax=Clostridium paridis TaxID=2803863 RepID=A0A937FKJ0_9CLOT|nr:fluoride efflux transporter CrcB [Clostridium paridis]MBL4933606.1 fluoride efflux transporter CrcB [Clostridium paridis]